jgi:WD40 repeat protein
MWKCRTILWLAISALAASALFAQAPPEGEKKPSDLVSADTLPDGARLRFGTAGLGLGETLMGGTLSPDGKLLAVATRDEITVLERMSGKPLGKVGGMPLGVPLLALTADGKTLAYGTGQSIVLAEMPSGNTLQTLAPAEGELQRGRSLSFSANGKVVAVGEDRYGAKVMPRAHVWNVADGKHLGTFQVAQNSACYAAVSPDGKRLATWGKHVVRMIGESEDATKIVQQWDIATGSELRQLKIDRANVQINAVAYSADGKTIAVASGMSTFHLFDAASGDELRRFAGRRGITAVLQFSPDGKLLVAGSVDGAVQAWHTADGARLALQPGPHSRILSFGFPGEGQIVALGIGGQGVFWWDAVTGKSGTNTVGHQTSVLAVAFAPDGRTVTSVSFDGGLLTWDAASGKIVRQMTLADDQTQRALGAAGLRMNTLALSADARYAATGTMYATSNVRLWDLRTGQVACDFEASKASGSFGVAFTPKGDRLAAAGLMKFINVWDTESGQDSTKLTYTLSDDMTGTGAPRVAFAPDGKTLAAVVSSLDPNSGTPWARVLLLDAATGKQRVMLDTPAVNVGGAAFAGGPALAAGVAFSADSKLLALPGPNQSVLVVRTDTGKEWKKLEVTGGFAAITTLAFCPDGRTVAVAHGGQRIIGPTGEAGSTPPMLELWELASGQRRVAYRGQQGGINCLAFAPDGTTIASGSADTTVMLWDVTGTFGQKPIALKPAELDTEWASLAKPDGEAAFRAQRRLVAAPGDTLAFLARQLRPAKVTAVDEKEVTQSVMNLDSEDFNTRDQSFRALEKLGIRAENVLRKARAGKISLEMRRRIDDLLEKIERGNLTAEELQATRAVEVLEHIATPQARELLVGLAAGAESAVLTREAQKALRRLKQ